MIESITEFLKENLSAELCIFVISMLPILELRGGIIAAFSLGVPWYIALPICVVGNMIPIPFELLFIRKIFNLLKKIGPIGRIVDKIEKRAESKSKTIRNGSLIGLFLLVAIPLPGTGAWTGGLIADILDLRMKHSIPVITAGVIAAGLIVSAATYGLFSVFTLF